jgi:ABC-2 type transport system permease protein
LAQKEVIIIAFIVVPIMIGVAVLFTGKANIKGHIALVSNNAQSIPKDNRIKIDVMNKKPAVSNLLLGKYIAIVEEKSNGSYDITTFKNETDKKIIENFFKTGKIAESNEGRNGKKGAGTNILGFILMILLMQGIALIALYTEDRNIKTFRRVLTSPVNERQYIFAQGIFTFLCLYIPSYLALVITKAVFGVNIGFNYGMLSILIGILSALSTSLALFMATVLDSNYSLAASGIYTITCVLSGCYISFTGSNKILNFICDILPQKEYMTLIQGIENGSNMLESKGQLIYLLIWIVALWLVGSSIIKKKMKQGIY